jgi:hypothetical protein
MKIKFYFNLVFLLFFTLLPAAGQTDTSISGTDKADYLNKSFALFQDDDLLEVTLKLDLAAYLKKNLKGDSKNATMTFYLSDKDSIEKKVSLNNRGKFRLEKCSFPPMKVNFKKQINAYPDSAEIKKIKLVVHCRNGNLYDEYVLREYLVYRMFNIITDTSYRVRLLRINYIDILGKRKSLTQFAFFIEPDAILAERTNSVILETPNITQKNIVPVVMDRISMFNYMVSNWDWTIPGQHNVTVLKSRDLINAGQGLAVPYDFDLTGIVNSNYATTPPEYQISNVRDRIFLGICRNKEVFDQELNDFLALKSKFYNLVNDFPYLEQRSKNDITGFLDQFFDQIERPRSRENLLRILTSECKDF